MSVDLYSEYLRCGRTLTIIRTAGFQMSRKLNFATRCSIRLPHLSMNSNESPNAKDPKGAKSRLPGNSNLKTDRRNRLRNLWDATLAKDSKSPNKALGFSKNSSRGACTAPAAHAPAQGDAPGNSQPKAPLAQASEDELQVCLFSRFRLCCVA